MKIYIIANEPWASNLKAEIEHCTNLQPAIIDVGLVHDVTYWFKRIKRFDTEAIVVNLDEKNEQMAMYITYAYCHDVPIVGVAEDVTYELFYSIMCERICDEEDVIGYIEGL